MAGIPSLVATSISRMEVL